jgi:hypothetical protein
MRFGLKIKVIKVKIRREHEDSIVERTNNKEARKRFIEKEYVNN